MRKVVVVLLLCLGVLVATTEAPERLSTGASAAEVPSIAPVAAVAADSLVDGYGVGIHLAFLDTPYADASAVADKLGELGVRHVRDDLFMNNPRQYAGIKTVADKGIRFNLIMGRPTSALPPAEYVNTVATQLPAGSVESLEGTNEWDLFSGGSPSWATELMTHQRDLYQASKANPATAHLPVLAPALAFRWNYIALGDLTPYADYANAHMYPGGYQPSNEVSRITTAVRGVVDTGKPLITTEAGYHNALNTTNGHLPVPEDVAGVYLPRLLLEHYLRGEKRVYGYELIDEFDDPGLTNPEAHFGLLRRDLSPKPAYTAMKTLLGLVSDPGPAFTPQALPVKIEGYPGDARYVLTQKRNGQHVLLLWRDVSVYDPVLKQPQTVAPVNVTLRLAKTSSIQVYRPSQGPAAVTQTQTTAVPLQLDGQVTAITIGPIPAPAPQSVSATAGNREATVSWQLPTSDANGSGFEIVRQPGTVRLSAPATTRTFRDAGLVNGRSYTYSVRALSPDGSSAAVAASPVIPATVPSAPTISGATAGRGSVTLTWTKPADQGRAIAGYRLVSGTKSLLVGSTVLKATLTGLAKGVKRDGWRPGPQLARLRSRDLAHRQDAEVDARRPRNHPSGPGPPVALRSRDHQRPIITNPDGETVALESEERPWGSWHVIDVADGYKIKRIHVNPGARLSLQSHEHRSEHWVVIQGEATCEINGVETIVGHDESIDVPLGARHRLGNQGAGELVIVEVQLGGYTGEDDICRYEDDYGRSD